MEDSEVTGAAGAFACGVLVLDGSLVHLDIPVSEDFFLSGGEDEADGFGGHAGPASQGLPGEVGTGVEFLDR